MFCIGCGKEAGASDSFCLGCGRPLSDTEPVQSITYRAPTKNRGLLGKTIAIVFVVVFVGAIIRVATVIYEQSAATSTESSGRPIPSSVGNDAELLLSRCGVADKDWSTQYDDPQPAIATRFITYKKAHLKFAYIPGGGSKVNDPPPYTWKMIGIIDTRTNKAVTAEHLKSTLETRLPCYLVGTN